MKKKELVKLMEEAAGKLSTVSPDSRAVVGGERVPVHQFAHGAAMALGLAALWADKPAGDVDAETLIAVAINSAIDWERENGIIGGEAGEDE